MELSKIMFCSPEYWSTYCVQCDQMMEYFLSIWPFTTMKTCPMVNIFATVGSQFCQIPLKVSKTFKVGPKWRNFEKNVHIDRVRLISLWLCRFTFWFKSVKLRNFFLLQGFKLVKVLAIAFGKNMKPHDDDSTKQ